MCLDIHAYVCTREYFPHGCMQCQHRSRQCEAKSELAVNYIHMCAYVYIYTRICNGYDVYVCIYMYMHMCGHASICTCIYYVHTCVNTRIFMCIHYIILHAHLSQYAEAKRRLAVSYIYVYVCIYTCICICTCTFILYMCVNCV